MNDAKLTRAVGIWIITFLVILFGLPIVLVAGRELYANPAITIIAAIFASLVAVIEVIS